MHNRTVHPISFIGLMLGACFVVSSVRAEPPTSPSAVEAPDAQAAPAASLADGATSADVSAEEASSGVNRPMLRTSVTLFAVPYAITFITAMAKSKETDPTLYVPVAGPFIELGNDTSPGNKVLLVGSGVLQAVGLVGIVSSFFVPESKTKNWPLFGNRRVTVTPVADRSDYHLVVRGRF